MANLLERYESESYPGHIHVVCQDDVEIPGRYGWGPTLEEARQEWAVVIMDRVCSVIDELYGDGLIDHDTWENCCTDLNGLDYLPWV